MSKVSLQPKIPTFIAQGGYGCVYSAPIGQKEHIPLPCKEGLWCVTKIIGRGSAEEAVKNGQVMKSVDPGYVYHVPTFDEIVPMSKEDQTKYRCTLSERAGRPYLMYQEYAGVALDVIYKKLSLDPPAGTDGTPLKLGREFFKSMGNIFEALVLFTSKIHESHEIVVHGDLKLGNILLDEKGQMRLIDFDFSLHYNLKTLEGENCFVNVSPYAMESKDAYSVWPPEVYFLYYSQPRRRSSYLDKGLIDPQEIIPGKVEPSAYEKFLRGRYFHSSSTVVKVLHLTLSEIDRFVEESLGYLRALNAGGELFEYGRWDAKKQEFVPDPAGNMTRLTLSFATKIYERFDLWGLGLTLKGLLAKDAFVGGKFQQNISNLETEIQGLAPGLGALADAIVKQPVLEGRPTPVQALKAYTDIIEGGPVGRLLALLSWPFEKLNAFLRWSRLGVGAQRANSVLKPLPAFIVSQAPRT